MESHRVKRVTISSKLRFYLEQSGELVEIQNQRTGRTFFHVDTPNHVQFLISQVLFQLLNQK